MKTVKTMSNYDALVTIIIPCYNVEQYISQCLDSFLVQTYKNIEIICVDDGSTDNTAKVIEEYVNRDSRISLIRQKNLYAGVARNNGLKVAKGEYVLFFDGDDFCDATMIEEMVDSAEHTGSDIVACDMKHYDNVTGETIETAGFLRMSYIRDYRARGFVSWRDIPDYILMFAFSGPPNKLYRKKFLDENDLWFQDSRRDNDEYFVQMSLCLAERISWVEKKFVTYRINNPMSLQGFGEKDIDTEDILSTTRALKAGLLKYDRYEAVENSFKNQVLMRYVGLLEGQRSYKNFIKVYDLIKGTILPEFAIDAMPDNKVIARAKERQMIMTLTANEYLFRKMKQLQGNRGELYPVPWGDLRDACNIGIYGAGTVGKSYYNQLKRSAKVSIVGMYDANAENLSNTEYPILSIKQMVPQQMDKIIIAVEEQRVAEEIQSSLIDMGFQEEQIVWNI